MLKNMLLSLICCLGTAQTPQVQKVEARKDLFRTGDMRVGDMCVGEAYIGGQPNLETLRWLKEQGVDLVVNLRMENENKDFSNLAFQEEPLVKELGMEYLWLPMEKGTPGTLEAFAERMKRTKGKVFIHCATGGRATNLWMAYLVRHRGLTLDDAVAVGRKMKFVPPLEDLLGDRVSLKLITPDPVPQK